MNPEVQLTLDDAVEEVLGALTGLDLVYDPAYDRYRAVTRQINRALRANALEKDWSYYASTYSLGQMTEGERFKLLADDQRPRIINDDAARLVEESGRPVMWAYFLPRDALHKYADRSMLFCSVTRNLVQFNRPFDAYEATLTIELPIMREPVMFNLPSDPDTSVDQAVRDSFVDFDFPDVIVQRAAYYVALSDPVMQPRAQTLEAQYKDLMYQLIERDDHNTDTPYLNDFHVPVQNGIYPETKYRPHPLADERR